VEKLVTSKERKGKNNPNQKPETLRKNEDQSPTRWSPGFLGKIHRQGMVDLSYPYQNQPRISKPQREKGVRIIYSYGSGVALRGIQ